MCTEVRRGNIVIKIWDVAGTLATPEPEDTVLILSTVGQPKFRNMYELRHTSFYVCADLPGIGGIVTVKGSTR
jgi:hypothetical protein